MTYGVDGTVSLERWHEYDDNFQLLSSITRQNNMTLVDKQLFCTFKNPSMVFPVYRAARQALFR